MAPHVIELLRANSGVQHPAGWGEQTIDVYRFRTEGRLIVLPHLSRFSLFNREESERSFREVL